MSTQYINYTIKEVGLDGLKIFYDFDSFSGDYVNSVSGGSSLYSGRITSDTASFTGQSSGSGFFNGQYIEVENHTGITSEDFTIIFSQEKTGISPGVVFSTIDENGPSGCEVGITASNKLYHKHFIDGGPIYTTLPSYASDKNIYAVTVDGFGTIKLRRTNFSKSSEDEFFKTDYIKKTNPAYTISNGSKMNIGSGEFVYNGYLDYFLYFDRVLSDDVINRLSKSIYGKVTITPPATGFVQGSITGYHVSSGVVSGEVGTLTSSTGVYTDTGIYTYESGQALTGAAGLSGIVYFPFSQIERDTGSHASFVINQTVYKQLTNLSVTSTLTGGIEIGPLSGYHTSGSYWHFSGNSGTYNGNSATGAPGTLFGITGFNYVTVTGYATGQSGDLWGVSGNSGVLYNTYSYSGQRGSGTTYTGTGELVSFSGTVDESYYPRALSLMNNVGESYFYEILYDISGGEDINKNAEIFLEGTYQIFNASRDNVASPPETQVAMNGVSLFTGSASYSKNQFNFPSVIIDTGFITSGVELYTAIPLDKADKVIYDTVPSGEKQSLLITTTGQYASAPFSEITMADNNIFFNGVKLYSGVDFVDDGGFYPSGSITGATGLYFTYPEYTDQKSVTGSGLRPLTVTGYGLNPHGYTAFYNGIRQPALDIIEHGNVSDLISGTTTLTSRSLVYRMSNGKGVI